jgi:hypothetical protein
MNRRDFLFPIRRRNAGTTGTTGTTELSCQQLYMRYVDSTLNGTASEVFQHVEGILATIAVVRLTDTAWLDCPELKPLEAILARFRERGGTIYYDSE